MLPDWQEAYNVVKCHPKVSEEALSAVQVRLTAETGELERLRLRVKKLAEKLLGARADVNLQTLLRDASREQLDAKVAELKDLQSHLEMRIEELTSLNEKQISLAAEMALLRTQNANKTSNFVELR